MQEYNAPIEDILFVLNNVNSEVQIKMMNTLIQI